MIVNLNQEVRVRLTNTGRRRLQQRINEGLAWPVVETDGWSKWHLWELMQIFGDLFMLGGEAPCEMDVDVLPNYWSVSGTVVMPNVRAVTLPDKEAP